MAFAFLLGEGSDSTHPASATSSQDMAHPGASLGGWDGWVLYTSEDGHKYHWNHLTHESRWAAVEEPIDDRYAAV